MSLKWMSLYFILASVQCLEGKQENPYFETFVIYPNPILLDESNKNAIVMDNYKWPNNTIPYVFDVSYCEYIFNKVIHIIWIISSQ